MIVRNPLGSHRVEPTIVVREGNSPAKPRWRHGKIADGFGVNTGTAQRFNAEMAASRWFAPQRDRRG
jgi:hypothetical protein